jgi:hypothetical protein|tara:strand:- start:171 stop:542 length:372 start_codon:yes stop_codon:yes gene_type:complete
MRTATTTSKTKKMPPKVVADKPISKAQVTKVPKPVAKTRGAARKNYKFNGSMPDESGFTPQMYALLHTISEAKKTELDPNKFTAQDLVALAVKRGFLSTCQDPLRIFRFYKDRLVSEGFISEV